MAFGEISRRWKAFSPTEQQAYAPLNTPVPSSPLVKKAVLPPKGEKAPTIPELKKGESVHSLTDEQGLLA